MDVRVVVAGGGPVGLSLALGLAHHGVSCVVLEANAQPAPESRAFVIWPRTMEVLRDWNAWDALRAAGRFQTKFELHNARTNRPMFSIDFNKVADIVDEAGVLILPQSQTERVLRDLTIANPACELRTGAVVTGVEQTGDGATVHFLHEGRAQTLRCEFVAACDGAHSVVREALGLHLEGMTYPGRVVLTDESISGASGARSPRASIEKRGLLAAIEWAPGLWRVMASLPKNASEGEAFDAAARAQRIAVLFGPDAVAESLWESAFHIHRRHAQRFVEGRIALAGDAAHVNSPAGGQGMNAGIQDAANLAWKIAYALRGGDAAALLDGYDVERREMVADTVERLTDRMTRLGLGMPSSARKLAILTFGKAVRGTGIQRKLCRALGMLSGRYTKSPLIDSRHPLAGRRIDDLRLADGTRLNSKRGGKAALVAVGNATVDGAISVTRAPKRWCVKAPAVLIVRPDGVVAAVVEKPTRQKIDAALQLAFAGAPPDGIHSTRSSIETL
jgi:2-polyprenyl-6-methoxyphenol hydroxylase-like FAD-dependent oxidoreductase